MLCRLRDGTGTGSVLRVFNEQWSFILGHMVWYSLRDVRINRTELEPLLIKTGINPANMTPEIRFADAFRRATTSITNRSPKNMGDG